LLAMCILVPTFASTLNMTRFYHITLFLVAPLFVIGLKPLAGFISKHRSQLAVSLLAMVVIVPYFLFQTNFVYEVTGSESWSVPLSKYRMDKISLYSAKYMEDVNVISAQWLSKYRSLNDTQLYADAISRSELLSYGKIYSGYIGVLSNTTIVPSNGVVYLSKVNVVYGETVGDFFTWDTTEFSPLFSNMSKIYSNEGSEVYAVTG
jgi:uncharacterized membrane protein